MFSAISKLWSDEPSRAQYSALDPANDLPAPAPICDIEKSTQKPTRTLRHLVKLNHANFALLDDSNRKFNRVADTLAAAHALDCSAEDIDRFYEQCTKTDLVKWTDSPSEVTRLDWQDFLGQTSYQRAYLDFFEDEVVEMGYHWRELAMRYLFHGERPLIQGIMSAEEGIPLTRLAYGLATSSREMTMEGLALLSACWEGEPRTPKPEHESRTEDATSDTLLELLQKLEARIQASNGAIPSEETIEQFVELWKEDSVAEASRKAQILAATLLRSRPSDKFANLFVATDALRMILHGAPKAFAIRALSSWWRETLRTYATEGCPSVNSHRPAKSEAMKWSALKSQANIAVAEGDDPRTLLVLHALQSAAQTWPDEDVFLIVANERSSRRLG